MHTDTDNDVSYNSIDENIVVINDYVGGIFCILMNTVKFLEMKNISFTFNLLFYSTNCDMIEAEIDDDVKTAVDDENEIGDV